MHWSRSPDGAVEVCTERRTGAQVRRSLKEVDKHVNERARQTLVPGEQTKLGMKGSAPIISRYTVSSIDTV